VQHTHALGPVLVGRLHLECQHLLAQELVEGLPEEVTNGKAEVCTDRAGWREY